MRPPTASARREVEESLAAHGGDVQAIARRLRKDVDDFIDFSSNTHIFAMRLAEDIARQTPYPLEHYPDTETLLLREAVAGHEGCDESQVLTGNGSAELIWLALASLAPRRILFLGPMFSEYVRAALSLGIEFEILTPADSQDFVPGPRELRAIWNSQADLAVLCTPNNPAGTTYPNIQELFAMLRIPRVLVDNTYREFLHGWPEYEVNRHAAYQEAARQGVSVFSMNSFTKFFCCPGLRLGYLIGESSALSRMARNRPPWMVSPYAEVMGIRFLENIGGFRDALLPLRREGQNLALGLRRNPAFDPDRVFLGPSFVTARLAGNASAAQAREALLKQGLVVRNCDSIPGMPPGYLRMQVRPQEDAERLTAALDWHGQRGWR